jgi:hypothetical protein
MECLRTLTPIDRREFVAGLLASGAASAASPLARAQGIAAPSHEKASNVASRAAIDFRYAPRLQQATICFPDDPFKSLVGERGDLRYGFAKGLLVGMQDFSTVCTFSLAGMENDRITKQWFEAPGIPIVHTIIERSTGTLEITSFASRHAQEGRVDNVLLTLRTRQGPVPAVPLVHIRTCEKLAYPDRGSDTIVIRRDETHQAFLIAAKVGSPAPAEYWWEENGYSLYLPHGEAREDRLLRYFIRLPQEGQPAEILQAGLQDPDAVLNGVRTYWRGWNAYGGVDLSYPGRHGEFLVACARNIQQSRELKNGKLVFQVGPTVYRNLWIVDGNFLLEAARYLGYDREADEGLRSEWNRQEPSGQVIAASGGEHWKDTAIAMFTLVRQCELKQDWSLLRELEPNVRHALDFLIDLRNKARAGNSVNGRYGLLAPGFADGGIGGVLSEFTNTVWTLAGLRAIAEAAKKQNLPALSEAAGFYQELRAAFLAATSKEMVRHPDGFQYLPMLASEAPAWHDADPWNRPRPQTAQWALSHAIYPGLVFGKNDPVVLGHIALMQSCSAEDVPAETGWLWHEAVWNYNASFVAHVYLWAGLRDWAHRTFTGFLNHASPLCCWREEQPLQHALVGQDWGDMPHNWASAECVRYLRHMLLLEDGQSMRLLEGITETELSWNRPYALQHTPTRFGRVDLTFEPAGRRRWRLHCKREGANPPSAVELPQTLGPLSFERAEGAAYHSAAGKVFVAPEVAEWNAYWG